MISVTNPEISAAKPIVRLVKHPKRKAVKTIATLSGLVIGLGTYSLLRAGDPTDNTNTNAPMGVLAGAVAVVVVHDEIRRRLRT